MSSVPNPRKVEPGTTCGFRARLAVSLHLAVPLTFFAAVQLAASSPSGDLSSRVDALFEGKIGKDTPGAAVLIARDGTRLLEKGYGLAQVEARIPVSCDTRFRIGSITKQFTAAAVLKLQEQGKLSIGDTISKYIQDWPKGGEVTLRHLLNHSSGVHNYTSKPGFQTNVVVATALGTLISSFKDDPYDFNPGDKFHYSNSGYVLLGHIIERVTGETYAAYLRKTFFEPLGMTNTGVYPSGGALAKEALGYAYEKGTVGRSVDWDMSNVAAAGNLYSTPSDLFLWNEALFHGKVLSTESIRAAFTVGMLAGDDPAYPEDTGYGFGWTIDRLNGLREISHGGELAGFGSYLLRIPEKDLTVVVLLNCVPQLPNLQQWGLAREIARRALGPELPHQDAARPATSVSGAVLDAIAGRYDMGGGMILTVRREGDRLFAEITDRKRVEMVPQSDRTFVVSGGGAEATFVRKANGQVGKAILKQGGDRIDAPRLKP